MTLNIDYDAIGLRVKFARLKAKMKQDALADKTGLSPAHISNIETGNTKLSLPAIIDIANALSVSVDELLCDNVMCSNHVYNKEAQELLADCSAYEIRVLLDILKETKDSLRKNRGFILENAEIEK